MENSPEKISPLVEHTAAAVAALAETLEATRGGRLPPERTLASDLQVSRATLRKALARLAEQGEITPAPQSGWFLRSAPLSAPPQRLLSFTELAAMRGQTPVTRLLSVEHRAPSPAEARMLGTSPEDAVVQLRRLRLLGDRPACLDTAIIATARVHGAEGIDWESSSLYDELERHHAVPTRSDFEIQAGLAGGEDGPLLEIDATDPVARVEELCLDQYGGPLLLGNAVYRAEIYRFHASLFRRSS